MSDEHILRTEQFKAAHILRTDEYTTLYSESHCRCTHLFPLTVLLLTTYSVKEIHTDELIQDIFILVHMLCLLTAGT